MSKGLKKSSKLKQKLYIKFLKNTTSRNEEVYKNYKNLFERNKMRSKNNYYSSLEKVITRLERDICCVNCWFKNNSMIANPDKFQVMFLGVKNPISCYVKDPIHDTMFSKYTEEFDLKMFSK